MKLGALDEQARCLEEFPTKRRSNSQCHTFQVGDSQGQQPVGGDPGGGFLDQPAQCCNCKAHPCHVYCNHRLVHFATPWTFNLSKDIDESRNLPALPWKFNNHFVTVASRPMDNLSNAV